MEEIVMQLSAWKKTVEDGIVILTFDTPDSSQNILTSTALTDLDHLFRQIEKERPVGVIITTAKPKSFCAGADIHEIKAHLDQPERLEKFLDRAHNLVLRMQRAQLLTVAAVSGVCLGGGMELALACYMRVATSTAQFSMPETGLGIIPGFGGTQLLPRRVSVNHASKIIVQNKKISAFEAAAIGLVDIVVGDADHPGTLNDAIAAAKDVVRNGNLRRNRKIVDPHWLERVSFFGTPMLLNSWRKQTLARTHGNYPALLKAIDAIAASRHGTLAEGLAIEKKLFLECAKTPQAGNLINLFFLKQKASNHGWGLKDVQPQPVTCVGVMGAGVMGRDIAYVLASADLPVVIHDISEKARAGVGEYLETLFTQQVNRGRMTREDANRKKALVHVVDNSEAFGLCDFIIEAITENLEIKRKAIAAVAQHAKPGAILATNTSTLRVSDIATAWSDPRLVCAMHFFNPVYKMELVEMEGGAETRPETLKTALELAKRLRKVPDVLAKECTGLIVNRILGHYVSEPVRQVIEMNINPWALDRSFERLGMLMGPFKELDLVGFDVGQDVLRNLAHAYPERFQEIERMQTLAALKNMRGKKDGKGFYVWEKEEPRKPNREMCGILGISSRKNESPHDRAVMSARDTILALMLNEAYLMLEEGIVDDPQWIDLAMVLGTGCLPPYGGLITWAESDGGRNLRILMTILRKRAAGEKRFRPCALMAQRAGGW